MPGCGNSVPAPWSAPSRLSPLHSLLTSARFSFWKCYIQSHGLSLAADSGFLLPTVHSHSLRSETLYRVRQTVSSDQLLSSNIHCVGPRRWGLGTCFSFHPGWWALPWLSGSYVQLSDLMSTSLLVKRTRSSPSPAAFPGLASPNDLCSLHSRDIVMSLPPVNVCIHLLLFVSWHYFPGITHSK